MYCNELKKNYKMTEKSCRFIILTGPPGCGKTTLVRKICNFLKEKKLIFNGFYTEEVRNGRERVGFDVVTLTGKRSPLARVQSDSCKYPKVGKYGVEVQSFESCVLPLLNSEVPNSILVLDEIGKMELLSHKFGDVVSKLISCGKNIILATVPVKAARPVPLIEAIKQHPDTCLITVDSENRNGLVEKISDLLLTTTERNLQV